MIQSHSLIFCFFFLSVPTERRKEIVSWMEAWASSPPRRGGGLKRRSYIFSFKSESSQKYISFWSVWNAWHRSKCKSNHKTEGQASFLASPTSSPWLSCENLTIMHYCLLYQMFVRLRKLCEVTAELLEWERPGFNSQLCYVTLDTLYNPLKLQLFHSKRLSPER